MALFFQRLRLRTFRTNNRRHFSLSSKTEKLLVTESEVPVFLPALFVNKHSKCQVNKETRTSLCYFDNVNTPVGYTLELLSSTEPEKTRKPVKSLELSGIEHLSFVQAEPGCVYEKPFDDFIIYESCRSLNDCHHHEFFKTSSSDAESELEHLKSNVSWCTDIDQFSSKPPFDKTPLEHLKSNVSWCTDITQSSSKPPLDKIPGRPSVEQIEIIREVLENTLPNFFRKPLNYNIYNQNVIFENNIWQKKTIGLSKYSLQMALIRIIGHFKYVQVTLVIVKITSHPEEGTIKVRWRIAGLSNTKALSFWRYRPGKFKEHLMDDSQWTDGFSTFYIGTDGLVFKHRVDQVIPDDEVGNVASIVDEKVAPVGFMSKTQINNLVNSVLQKQNCDLS